MARRPERFLPWLVLLVAALAVPTGATAQDPRVYIVSVPMDPSMDAVATRTGSAARAALRTIEGVDWRGPDQMFLGYGDPALNSLTRARERLAAGREAYLNLQLDEAISELEAAVENFDAAGAAVEDPGDLGQALLFLGASHAFNGQRRQALQVFRRLHTQMPHIQPDPDTFNPDVVQLYESARPPDARNPTGVIAVESDPPGATVYVDYLARGRAPIRVDGLITGEHVLRVSRPGATPYVEPLRVHRRRPATSNAFLVDREGLEGLQDALGEIDQADVGSIGEGNPIGRVASLLELSKIGVIRVSDAGDGQATLELLLFDAASGRRLLRGEGTVATEIGVLEAGVERLVHGAFEAALRPTQAQDTEDIIGMGGAEPAPEAPMAPGEPAIYEEWWFWTIIGAVVVIGAGVGIGLGLYFDDPQLGSDRGGQVIFTF